MTCWAVIPVKASDEAKSRLSGMLDAGERSALVEAMLDNVVSAALSAGSISKVHLVGPEPTALPEGVALLRDPGTGLNPAVQSALAEIVAMESPPERVIFVAADLPELTARDLDLLAIPAADTVVLAPDRHGTGTNALSLPLPAARDFIFAYGVGSYERHRREAGRLGLKVETIRSPGLGRDVDEPADLRLAGRALPRARLT